MKKRIIALTLVIVCIFGMISPTPVMALDILDKLFGGDNTNGDITNEQAEEQFKRLTDQAINFCRNGNYDAFAALFRNTDNNTIEDTYQMFQQIIDSGFPDYDYTVCGGNGTYFYGYLQTNLTSGYYPHCNTMQCYLQYPFSYMSGEWKLDHSEDAQIAVTEELMNNEYPEEFRNACDAGRNAIHDDQFPTSLNGGIVIPGNLEAGTYFIWQNEDGSVGLVITVKNGTADIRHVSSVSVALSDNPIGTIFDTTFYIDRNIAPGKVENYTFTVEFDQVFSGWSSWGSEGVDRISIKTNCHGN